MSTRTRWALCILIVVRAIAAYWGYEYSTHSTPQKALAKYDSVGRPVETVEFAKGVVLIGASGRPNSLTAWYMTKNLWGWHVRLRSNALLGLSPQNYSVDFESFTDDDKTFVWGTTMIPIKEIVNDHNGKKYTCPVGEISAWHMVLPFTKSYFPYSEWSMVLPNGKTAPLFNG